jgi:hypothetical protein
MSPGTVALTTPEGGSQWGPRAMLDDDPLRLDSGNGSAPLTRGATLSPAATRPRAATSLCS